MNLLIPIALFGWIPLTIFFFLILKPHHAVIFSVIGGTLFLPMAGYDLPGIPPFTKNTAISFGLILGGRISGQRQAVNFRWGRYDLPALIWIFCPFATSLANNLGWYDGVAGVWGNLTTWGIPYLAGRIYIDSTDKLRDVCIAIVTGGLLYLPLCLYEIRMSPQLSNMIYGFFPHEFVQHMRYGGYRPIVFMQHGLMVAMWMATSTTVAFWLWRTGELKHIKGLPMSFFILALILTTILCKSANGWIALALGCGGYLIFRLLKSSFPFRILLLLIPLYILVRITGSISGTEIETMAGHIFDAERTSSLGIRLLQEELFIEKSLQHPLLGWGGYRRGWPIDEETGERIIEIIDSLWIITFNIHGFVGLFSITAMLLTGPWLVLHYFKQQKFDIKLLPIYPVSLSFIVIVYMVDNLVNSMFNPVYVLVSGALVAWYSSQKGTIK